MTNWIEKRQPYSCSLLWELQRRYFAERGIEAWASGEVPQYVTSNPTIANAYAEIVFAFSRDLDRLVPPGSRDAKLTICELGGGSGRFAFHFLRRLEHLCVQAGVAPETFRYVLTDAADANIDFWRAHPRFRPYLERGVLDFARFDVMQPAGLALQVNGGTIAAAAPQRGPLVVIGNYLFDSVPPDLFHVREKQLFRCLVSLALDAEPDGLDAGALLAALQVHYDYEALSGPPYAEPWLQEPLTEYRHGLQNTHLTFPAAGLRCLRTLAGWSERGLLVLSADKGENRLERLDGLPPPDLVRHGSVSLSVNYHAFIRMCERAGGLALVPDHDHSSIDVIGLLMMPDAAEYAEIRQAYRRHVQDFGPDGFYVVSRHARAHIAQMSVEEMLAYLRLSRHDSHLLVRYLSRLTELAAEFGDSTRRDVTDALEKVWDGYFPLGEDVDLAAGIAELYYAMDDFPRARVFFERSIEIYGADTGTLFNIGACLYGSGDKAAAAAVLRNVLDHDSGNEPARLLLADCEAKAA